MSYNTLRRVNRDANILLPGPDKSPPKVRKSNFVKTKLEADVILQNSGILDWKEDAVYFRAQMTKEQPGGLES